RITGPRASGFRAPLRKAFASRPYGPFAPRSPPTLRLAPVWPPVYIGGFAPDRRTPMPPTRTAAPNYDATNPLFVQPDRSILLETFNPKYAEARDPLAPFA